MPSLVGALPAETKPKLDEDLVGGARNGELSSQPDEPPRSPENPLPRKEPAQAAKAERKEPLPTPKSGRESQHQGNPLSTQY